MHYADDLLLLIFIIPSISITYFSSATKFLILLKKKNIDIIKTLGTGFDSSRDIYQYGFVNFNKRVHSIPPTSDKDYQSLAHGRWFFPSILAFSTIKPGRHDIAEIFDIYHSINKHYVF
jgi:hypothetical protein